MLPHSLPFFLARYSSCAKSESYLKVRTKVTTWRKRSEITCWMKQGLNLLEETVPTQPTAAPLVELQAGILRKFHACGIDVFDSNSIHASKLTMLLLDFDLARSKLWLHKLHHPPQGLVQLAWLLELLLAPLEL
jgi:hypothetical protein